MVEKVNVGRFDEDSKEENGARATWKKPVEFTLNLIGYLVGLGNVWRFPYLCYKNGGGAFLIPYLTVGIFCGLPLLFMEISLGQFTRKSGFGAWDLAPIMKGIGLTGLVMSLYYISYVPVIMGWSIFYFVHSFTIGILPWSTCDHEWNTKSCRVADNSTNLTKHAVNFTGNTTTTPTQEFWTEYVLQKSSGIDDIGGLTNWRMILCFLAAWVICYLCVLKGIHTSGKVAYFTVITPYVMLLVLLFRGILLEGAGEGMRYFIFPRPERLSDPAVWLDAGGQALYTLGVAFTVLYGLGSFNDFHTDSYKNSFLCIGVCYATSLLAGSVVFCYLGHMSVEQGKNISDVAIGGPGLLFEIFPTALSMLPYPPLWTALFFFVIILVAIDTAFGTLEGCTAVVQDLFPRLFSRYGMQIGRLVTCVFPFVLGIPMLADGGIYVFTLVDWYGCNGFLILATVIFESIGLAWIYGVDRFFDDVQKMIGYRPNVFFKYCYLYFTPGITLAIFIASCVKPNPLSSTYPPWANAIGWIIFITAITPIPIIAAKTLLEGKGNFKQRWRFATTSRIEKSELGTIEKEPMIEQEVPVAHTSSC